MKPDLSFACVSPNKAVVESVKGQCLFYHAMHYVLCGYAMIKSPYVCL